MKNNRILAFSAVLLCLVLIVVLIIMVKHVPRIEDVWQRTGEAITPVKALLLRVSHLCKAWFLLLLPVFVVLASAAAGWYIVCVRNLKNANKSE